MSDIDRAEAQPRRKLAQYAQLYVDVLRQNRMCLCGMLAADYTTLPKEMKEGVKAFFDANEGWLGGVLEVGRKSGQLRFPGPAQEEARLLVGSLEGAMLVARSYGDVSRFTSATGRLLAELDAGARPRAGPTR